MLEQSQPEILPTLIKFRDGTWFSSLYQSGECIGTGRARDPIEAVVAAVEDSLVPKKEIPKRNWILSGVSGRQKKVGIDEL